MTLMSDTSCIWWGTFLPPVTWTRYNDRWEPPHRGRTSQAYESHRWLWSLWYLYWGDRKSNIHIIKSLFLKGGIFYIFLEAPIGFEPMTVELCRPLQLTTLPWCQRVDRFYEKLSKMQNFLRMHCLFVSDFWVPRGNWTFDCLESFTLWW